MPNFNFGDQSTPKLVALAAILLLGAILLSYLVTTGLVAIVIWAFALDYNVWAAGLGVWAILIILKQLFQR